MSAAGKTDVTSQKREPGSMKAGLAPTAAIHRRTASAGNAGPLCGQMGNYPLPVQVTLFMCQSRMARSIRLATIAPHGFGCGLGLRCRGGAA